MPRREHLAAFHSNRLRWLSSRIPRMVSGRADRYAVSNLQYGPRPIRHQICQICRSCSRCTPGFCLLVYQGLANLVGKEENQSPDFYKRYAPDFLLVTQPPESWPAAFWKQDFEQLIAAHGLIHVVLRFVQFFGTLIYVKRRCFHIKGGSPTFGKPQNEKLPVNTGSLCAFDAK